MKLQQPSTSPTQEWRDDLTPEQYEVLRRKGTEAPFSGKYVYNHDDGMYRCAACGAELFSSDTKFDSGTGWPSFTSPAVAEHIKTEDDRSHGMTPHRGDVRPLRRPSRPRLPRRARPRRASGTASTRLSLDFDRHRTRVRRRTAAR